MRAQASLHSPFARLGAFTARHARVVVAAVAVSIAVAASYGASVTEHLSAVELEAIGSDSARVRREAARRFGIGAADVLVLYRNPGGDVRDPLFGIQVLDALEPVLADEGVLGAITLYDTNESSLVSRDHSQTLVTLALAGNSVEKLRTFRRVEPLLRGIEAPVEVEIGGVIPLSTALQEVARRDALAAERVALPIALVLTLLFFRSFVAALLPILMGGCALALSAGLTRLGTHVTDIAVFSMNVGAFLGLGLSIDYALLMVQRFREELARGRTVEDAVAATMDTAGRAVAVSGAAVAISLAALVPVPVMVLRSVAIGGVLVVVSALLGALLLLPALLAWLGPWVNRGSLGRPPEAIRPSPFWSRVGGLSMRHPIATGLACVVVLGAFASPVLRMRGAIPDSRALPAGSEARLVDEALADPAHFDPGGASAIQILVETPGSPLAPETLRKLHDFFERLEAVPGAGAVRSVLRELDRDAVSRAEWERQLAREPTASRLRRTVDADAALVIVENPHPWRSRESAALVEALRAVPHPGIDVLVGGPSAQVVDQIQALRDHRGLAVLLVAAANLVILFFAFRSVVVPIKAVLMNVLSLGASYGVLVWIFQDGHGAGWLGFTRLDGIDPTIPLVMFAIVFGLSMDYEVFLLSRIREEWLQSGDNRQSVLLGLARTGRIITSAALILLVVVGAFASGELIYVQQMGVGMVVAIALDVTIVRALLVPATMQLLGDWNWWAPRWLRASHRKASPERGSVREPERGKGVGS
jgi:RND superfamily putative drug exporter